MLSAHQVQCSAGPVTHDSAMHDLQSGGIAGLLWPWVGAVEGDPPAPGRRSGEGCLWLAGGGLLAGGLGLGLAEPGTLGWAGFAAGVTAMPA